MTILKFSLFKLKNNKFNYDMIPNLRIFVRSNHIRVKMETKSNSFSIIEGD